MGQLATDMDIHDFVMRERQMCISDREWKHRLRGYGYAIRDTDEGWIVTSIMRGGKLCELNAAAPAA